MSDDTPMTENAPDLRTARESFQASSVQATAKGVTHAVKRCKGCIFWQVYHGEMTNSAMRRLHSQAAPRSKQHACVLRLHQEEGKAPKPSFNPQDAAGPNYGKRIGPNGVCDHHTAGRQPWRKPGPVTVTLTEQAPVDGYQGPEPPALETELRSVEVSI